MLHARCCLKAYKNMRGMFAYRVGRIGTNGRGRVLREEIVYTKAINKRIRETGEKKFRLMCSVYEGESIIKHKH